jgi:hypothetical protein
MYSTINDKVIGQTIDQIRILIQVGVSGQIWYKVQNQVYNPVSEQVWRQMGFEVMSQVIQQVYTKSKKFISQNIINAVT